MRRRLLLLPLAALLLPAAAEAQSVRGHVRDRDGRGVAGVLVTLVDSAGAPAARAVSAADGSYRVTGRGAGTYRLRAERVGFAPVVTEPLRLAADDRVARDLAAATEAVRLEGIVATVDPRCDARPEGTTATAALWEQARTALATVAASEASELYAFRTERFRVVTDAATRRVREERRDTVAGPARTPFVVASPARVEAHGFVDVAADSVTWHAPDAALLLSDAFLARHCFRVARGGPRGMVGLAFEPARDVPRGVWLRGTLWLDRATAELRRVEYRYEGAGGATPVLGDARGRVEFARLADAGWIVRRWEVRAPVLALPAEDRPREGRRPAPIVLDYHELGAVVREVRGPDGRPIALAAP